MMCLFTSWLRATANTYLILLYTAIPCDGHKDLVVLQTVMVCSYAVLHILDVSKQKEHITGLNDLHSRQETCLCRVKWLVQRVLSPRNTDIL